jgi:hypothetical protein
MGSEARLSDQQKRRATEMAREKDLTCPDCGGSEPVPKDEVPVRHPDGGAEVAMSCVECESTSEMTLVLSPEEAKALGLHALRDRPDTP